MGAVTIMVDLAKGGFREWYKTTTFRLENMWVHLYEAHDACYCPIKTFAVCYWEEVGPGLI